MPYNLYKTDAIILWSSFCTFDFHFAVFRLIWQPQRNLGRSLGTTSNLGIQTKVKGDHITTVRPETRPMCFLSKSTFFILFWSSVTKMLWKWNLAWPMIKWFKYEKQWEKHNQLEIQQFNKTLSIKAKQRNTEVKLNAGFISLSRLDLHGWMFYWSRSILRPPSHLIPPLKV